MTISACPAAAASLGTLSQKRTKKRTPTVRGAKADSYAYEKLIRKWTKSVFFGVFQSYGYENGPDSYGQIRLSFS